jgi:hypothetical protein
MIFLQLKAKKMVSFEIKEKGKRKSSQPPSPKRKPQKSQKPQQNKKKKTKAQNVYD